MNKKQKQTAQEVTLERNWMGKPAVRPAREADIPIRSEQRSASPLSPHSNQIPHIWEGDRGKHTRLTKARILLRESSVCDPQRFIRGTSSLEEFGPVNSSFRTGTMISKQLTTATDSNPAGQTGHRQLPARLRRCSHAQVARCLYLHLPHTLSLMIPAWFLKKKK